MPFSRAGDAAASPRPPFARIALLVLSGTAAALGPLGVARWVRWDALHYYFHVETCLAVSLLGAIGLAKRRPRLGAMMLVALLPTLVGVVDASGTLRQHAAALAATAGHSPAAGIADFLDRVPRAWGSLAWGEGTGGLAVLMTVFCAAMHAGRGRARPTSEESEGRLRLVLFCVLSFPLALLLLDHAGLCWARRELVNRLAAAGPLPAELTALQTAVDQRRWALLAPVVIAAALVTLLVARATGGVAAVRRAGGGALGGGLGAGLAYCVALLIGERLLDRDLATLHSPLAILDASADVVLPPGQTGGPPEPSGTIVLVDATGAVQLLRASGDGGDVTLLGDARAPFAPVHDLLERQPSPGGMLAMATCREGDPWPWPSGSLAAQLDFGLALTAVAFESRDATAQRLARDRGKAAPRQVVLLDEDGARAGLLGWQGTVPVTLGEADQLQELRDPVEAAVGAFPSRGVDVAAGPGVAWGRVARVLFAMAVDARTSVPLEGVTLVLDRTILERELAEPVPSAAPADAIPVPHGRVTFFEEDPDTRPDRTKDAPAERLLPSSAAGPMPEPPRALFSTRDWRRKKDPPLLWNAPLEASLQTAFGSCYASALTSAPDLRGEIDAVVSVVPPATIVQVLGGNARHFTQSLPAALALTDCLRSSAKATLSRVQAPVESWDTFSVTARFEPRPSHGG